jgi:hypothetical protein
MPVTVNVGRLSSYPGLVSPRKHWRIASLVATTRVSTLSIRSAVRDRSSLPLDCSPNEILQQRFQTPLHSGADHQRKFSTSMRSLAVSSIREYSNHLPSGETANPPPHGSGGLSGV